MYHKMGYLFTGLDSAALLMFKYQIYWFGQIPTIDSETGQQYSDVSILCINIFDLVSIVVQSLSLVVDVVAILS